MSGVTHRVIIHKKKKKKKKQDWDKYAQTSNGLAELRPLFFEKQRPHTVNWKTLASNHVYSNLCSGLIFLSFSMSFSL